ncbi:MAG TPA: TetR/AcrR family transcriptional regulator [Gemmatimonadales bacterium]|nr:TetR/AcrR family transcriptional regulator [Gemmatimonadales bacterium]
MTALPPPKSAASRPARSRDAQATRSRLIRAALDLFTGQGFRATTTPEIAQRAGVAEATIYRHFPGKDALLTAACVEAQNFGRALVTMEEAEHDRDTRAALGRIGRRLAEAAERDPALLRMLLRPPDEALLEEPPRRAMREFRAALEQIMAAGKQRGQVRPGSAELWAAVWLALAGFVVERIAAKEWSREHPNVEQALDAAWEAIAYRRPGTPVTVVS